MRKNLTFLTLLLGLCVSVHIHTFAQDARFAQNFSNPLFLNPAFAGSLGCSRMAVNYRNQWRSFNNNYYVFTTSYDEYVDKLSGGVGLQFYSDQDHQGIFSTNFVNGFYAYNLNINENLHIRPAINIGMGIKQLDWNRVAFPPSVDSTSSKYYFNVGTGLLLVYKNFITGISYDHINTPDIGFNATYKLPSKLTVHSNYQLEINEKTLLTPGIIFRKQQDLEEIVFNLLLNIRQIKLGVGYMQSFQNADNVMGTVGFCNDRMSIGYSYDVFISKLSNNALAGTHEISAVFKVSCKNDKDKFKITQLRGF